MATAINSPARAGTEIKLEYGQPEVFALRFITGKNIDGRYGPRVLFTAVDERKLWLDAEDGSDLERGMLALNVRPADFIRVTKVKHPRGGGHSIRVELAEETRLEADLRQSIANVEETRRIDAQRESRRAAVSPESAAPIQHQTQAQGRHPQESAALSPTALRFMGAYKDSVDILIETQGYAKSRDVLLDVRCEDVRCLAATIMIDLQKQLNGGGR